jgi:RNA polymerase sigma-70 factor (ECF subfamily)
LSAVRLPLPKTDHARWFSEEVLPHEGSLRRYLRGLLPTFPDIDDLVQEAYTRMIRAKDAGKINYAKAFLFATARNAALDFLRRRKIVSIDPIGDMTELCVLEDGLNSADALNRQQELALLAEAVRALPERCRQVLTLRMLYGLSHKEIAENLRISDHTVKAQLAKGMRRCAEYLEQRGVTPARTGSSPHPR